jgi:hypothetical protein
LIKPDALENDELQITDISRSLTALFVVVAGISAFISFQYALKIKFGPIDDHEVFTFLGPKQQIRWLDIPNLLWTKTEIGRWGTSSRYRPSYYTIRVFETKVFGTNPALWYGLRVLFVAVASFLLSIVTLQLSNLRHRKLIAICGVISILSILSLNAWIDVIMRLGPAEFYLSVGYALFFYLLITNIQQPRPASFVALAITLIVVSGSKENGVSLLLPFLLLTAYLVQKKAIGKTLACIWGLFTLIFSALIIIGPLGSIDTAGADIYGNQRSLKGSVILGLDYIKSSDFQKISSLLLVVVFCSILQCNRNKHNIKHQVVALLISGFFVMQIVFEHIFYMGNFGALRYTLLTDISKILLLQIAIFSTVGLVVDILGKRHFRTLVVSLALLSFSLPAIFSNFKNSVISNQKTALSRAENTREYQQKIKDIVQALSERRTANVIIQVNDVGDYEPVYSLIQYLQYYSPGFSFFLNLQIPPVSPGLETTLLAELSEVQLNGSKRWNVKPKPLEWGSNNLCIVFNGAPAVPNVCEATYGV